MGSRPLSKLKNLFFVIVILCSLFLCINTNNNPYSIIERIYKPINFGAGTIHYAGIIIILAVYFSINEIYKNSQSKLLNTRFRRIIVLVLIMDISTNNIATVIKEYKGFSTNLNSIYCNRENMSLTTNPVVDGMVTVVCNLELENCSSKIQKFYVNTTAPGYLEGKIKEEVLAVGVEENGNGQFILHGKEKRNIQITYLVKDISGQVNWSFNTSYYEFSLYNNNQETKFTQIKENIYY
ncbi:hypothetical protein [Clostridium sp.]